MGPGTDMYLSGFYAKLYRTRGFVLALGTHTSISSNCNPLLGNEYIQINRNTVRHLLFLACLLLTSFGSTQSARSQDRRGGAEQVRFLPPEHLEITGRSSFSIRSAVEEEEAETLYLERLSTLFGYQSDLMAAEARNDQDAIVSLLDLAMNDLGRLIQLEDVAQDARFSLAYRVLVDEYERFYGPSDTLFSAFGDIYDLQRDLFATLENIDNPLLEDVVPAGLLPVGTEVEMTMNRLVQSSMEFLLRERRESLQAWMSRADTYFPMIEKIFSEEGVPDELKYMAMIESGLNPRARSWARAVGMWQFVAATGRAYDLNVNAWVDDRMDPELATRAAARHLKELYVQYDSDWQIALAGYNCSYRCIRRAIRNSGKSDPTYWDIYRYLPRETRNYVPTFIATSLIASNPEAYGLERGKEGPAYAYHIVPVTGMLSLKDVARMANTDVATIKALNPNLRRESLPPTIDAFYLRIPIGTYESFTTAFEALPESEKRPSGEHVVKRGDTLSGIGYRFGVSVSQLMQKNGLKRTNIRIGQRLIVPVAQYAQSIGDAMFEDESQITVQYGRKAYRPILVQQAVASVEENISPVRTISNRARPTSKASTSPSSAPVTDTRVTYRVRSGDTLSEIAEKYNVSVRKIRGWSNLSGTSIKVGQRLIIYTNRGEAPSPDAGPIIHRIRRGDTLSEIASEYEVTVSQLRKWNGIRGSNIRADQRIKIYSSLSGLRSHTVKSGDTLIKIGQQYGVSVANIKTWNDLRSNTIRIGQVLKIFR